MLADKEGVLHVTGRMIGSEVHLSEHMQVIFHLRTVGKDESHTRENIDNLVSDNGQWMTGTQLNRVGSACQIDSITFTFLCLAFLAELIDTFCGKCFQLVDFHTNGLLLVGSHITEISHQCRNLTFFAEIFQS